MDEDAACDPRARTAPRGGARIRVPGSPGRRSRGAGTACLRKRLAAAAGGCGDDDDDHDDHARSKRIRHLRAASRDSHSCVVRACMYAIPPTCVGEDPSSRNADEYSRACRAKSKRMMYDRRSRTSLSRARYAVSIARLDTTMLGGATRPHRSRDLAGSASAPLSSIRARLVPTERTSHDRGATKQRQRSALVATDWWVWRGNVYSGRSGRNLYTYYVATLYGVSKLKL